MEHVFGSGELPPDYEAPKVEVFQHRLLQHFMLSIFCKLPVQSIKTIADLETLTAGFQATFFVAPSRACLLAV